jgi:hypothetical protein
MGKPLMHMSANNVHITAQQPINQIRRFPFQFPDIIIVFNFVIEIKSQPLAIKIPLRNGHSESFSHSKKVPKLTEGKIFHPFFGLFLGGFGPVMALFGGVS